MFGLRRHILRCMLVVVSVASCVSCGRDPERETLISAETALADSPDRIVSPEEADSILKVVSAVDRDKLAKEEDKALYDLLLVKASAKMYRDDADQESIERVANTLDREGYTRRAAEAHYYYGRTALNMENAGKAVEQGLLSLDIATRICDAYLSARSHELLADAYRSVYNLRAARLHRHEAVRGYESGGFRLNAFYATMDLAGEYSHESNDSAYVVMDRARRLLGSDWVDERRQFEFMYADICRVLGDYGRSLEHYRRIDRTWLSEVMAPEDSVRLGEVYYYNAVPDSAEAYFATPAVAHDIAYWECMADKYEKLGDDGSALECYRNLRGLSNDRSGVSLGNALESVERVFYEDKAYAESKRHRHFVNVVWWVAAGLLFMLLIGLVWRYRRKASSLRAENEIKDVALLAGGVPESSGVTVSYVPSDSESGSDTVNKDPSPSDVCDNDSASEDKEKWVNVILDFYMSRLNAISREYFKVSEPGRLREIETEFNKELRLLRYGDIFDEIERRLNERNDNIAKKIRREYPKFNEQYVRLMLCSLAGLSSQSACLLLSIQKGNYYVMWTRIRNRIRSSAASDRDLFIRLFCNPTPPPKA